MDFSTERLKLREVLPDDIEKIHALHSFPEVDQYNTLGIPASIEVTEKLVKSWVEYQNGIPRDRFVFSIFEKQTLEFIGLFGLNFGRPGLMSAEVWYKIMPHYWGKGYATESLKAALEVGFSAFKLHRIEAGCAVDNAASIKVLEKSGFLREGRKRKILPIRGEWKDNFIYAVVDEDWAGRDNVKLLQ